VDDKESLFTIGEGASGGRTAAGSWFYELAKCAIDPIVSFLVLLFCLPLLPLVALAIKLESRGPVFFCQERAGRNGVPFTMFKLRSMRADAERKKSPSAGRNGPVFKLEDDPRVTRVGRWLRRTSLDELPQFVNVLIGDMSLVGPRPLPLRDVNDRRSLPEGVTASEVNDWVQLRQTVRPGITGLWQVSGRSLLPLDEWLRYDLRYVRERSMALDLKILVLTPFVALRGRGAV